MVFFNKGCLVLISKYFFFINLFIFGGFKVTNIGDDLFASFVIYLSNTLHIFFFTFKNFYLHLTHSKMTIHFYFLALAVDLDVLEYYLL